MGFDKDYREIPITWERGMVETVEASMLPMGAAARLRNWESDPSGNLRSRVGWLKGSTTSVPSTRKGVGVGHLATQRRPYRVQSAGASTPHDNDPITVTATWDQATVTGNLLVARLYSSGDADVFNSDWGITAPAGWTAVPISDATARASHAWIYYKANAASQSGTVAFTLDYIPGTNASSLALEISEYANIATSSPLDVYADNDLSTGFNLVSGSTPAVTVPVGLVVVAFGAHDNSVDDTFSAPTNGHTLTREFYEPGEFGSINDLEAVGTEKIYSAGGTKSVGVTSSTSIPGGGVAIATFKAVNYTNTDGFYFVANDENPNIKIYYLDRSNLAAGTWVLLESIAAIVGGSPVAFTSGNNKLFYTHPSFTAARSWGGLGTTPAAITGSPAGRCIAWHKNRLFIGGNVGEPWKLHFSETGDETIWDSGTATYIEVGRGDGEAIEDITPFQDGLLIGKQTSLWFLTGSGPDNFRLIRLPIGGAAPGRSVLATPFGAIVAGRKDVWLVNGGTVEHISGPIRESYGITDNWMCCSFLDDQAYVLDEGSGTIWVVDFSTGGTWHEERIDSASTSGPAIIFNQDANQLYAPKNASVPSLLNYRTIPGSPRGKDFDTMTETWTAWTPEIWPAGPQEKVTPRYLYLKLRQRAGDAGDGVLSFTPVYDGTAITAKTITPKAAAATYWKRLDIGDNVAGKGVSSVQFKITQTLASTDSAVFDIEEMTLGYNVEPVG